MPEEIEDILPQVDSQFIREKGFKFSIFREAGAIHLVLHEYALPQTYLPQVVDLKIILPAGYPNANLDMFWTFPDVKLANGNWPQACEHHEVHNQINWQRWSRHFQIPWRQGVDNLRTYLATIKRELEKGI